MPVQNFLQLHQSLQEVLGFWAEEYLEVIKTQIEIQYKTDVLREWFIADLAINNGKVLIKWCKRIMPLSDEQLKEKYGR